MSKSDINEKTDKRKRSDTSSTSSLSDWDKSVDKLVEEINKTDKIK